MNGKVYIVGAGPGDPGLITIKGMECLKKAEVVVFDRLIDNSFLDVVPAGAEMIYVGKSAKVHAKEQDEINRILVEKAQEGRLVVRLKGGDPFVLGRGGEECEELAANSIPYEVVPGISSSIASPAYAGIPVTHRHVASSFAVITGHEDPTKEISSINWEKLSTGVDTLVFLMGMGNLPLIVQKLIECGRGPDTPIALVRRGTTLEQQAITGTLSTIVERAKESGFEPPVAIVVGEVVDLRAKLKWFENRPLFGKRVLVTRARTQASALSKLLSERGVQPVELPAIEIQPVNDPTELDQSIIDLPGFDWMIFTSANGVEAMWDRLVVLGKDARQFGSVKIGAIGPATAEALAERGLYPDFMPVEYTSKGILEGLSERDVNGCHILLPRADIAPKDLTEGLIGLGAEPVEVIAYLTKPSAEVAEKAKQMLLDGEIDIITFASSSTVTNLIQALGDDWQVARNAKIACIGPVTAATARDAGLEVDIIASEQTIPGLVDAIEEAYSND
jgi:uroporphyrinogen III methyltransferase / synthase